jgi:hypothetical protein
MRSWRFFNALDVIEEQKTESGNGPQIDQAFHTDPKPS